MTPREKKLLDWVTRKQPVLEVQVVGSGLSGALNGLLRAGLVTLADHPTVKGRGGIPATAVVLRKSA
jgi:hypothetical protein